MKILIVIDDYHNNSNGMSISTQRFVKEFKKLGCDVRVLAIGDVSYSLPEMKIPFFAKLIAQQGFHFALPVRKTTLKAVQWADYVHLDTPFPIGWQAGHLAKKMGKTVTGTFHIYPQNMTASVPILNQKWINNLIMFVFKKISYKNCDVIQCPTAKVKRNLQKYHFPQKLVVVSNGIAQAFIDNPHKTDTQQDFTILCIGRFSNEKDQYTLFRAMQVCKYAKNINLIFAGQGPLKDKFEALAKTLPRKPIMRYFNSKQLRKLEAKSQLVVHCANVEVEGMSCMEAFASGCVPIIASSDLSSTASYSLTKNNQFKAEDYHELAKRIEYWYEHPLELGNMSKKYQTYARSLNVNKCAKMALSMIRSAKKR